MGAVLAPRRRASLEKRISSELKKTLDANSQPESLQRINPADRTRPVQDMD
jgi:hypothetical protein